MIWFEIISEVSNFLNFYSSDLDYLINNFFYILIRVEDFIFIKKKLLKKYNKKFINIIYIKKKL